MFRRAATLLIVVLLASGGAGAATIEERVVEHHLANGLTLLMMERHQAPIVAVNVTYKVGGVHEHNGNTGVAHLYEHMAFKGTRTIGVTDAEKEKPVLAELDRLFDEIAAEKAKGPAADQTRLAALRKQFADTETKASAFVVEAELAKLYQRQGGVGLNATTGKDLTRYFLSFPSNRLPLWAAVESDRMTNAVLREFYKEKNVVLEERRQRTDNSPSGRLHEVFSATAFMAHPYGLPVIGWPSDLEALSRAQTEAFFKTHYEPASAVVAIVGDIKPQEVIALVEATFGKIPARPSAPLLATVEPPSSGERRVALEYAAEPQILIGLRKPATDHPDDDVFDMIESLLSQGRTSRLHRRLIQEKQLATTVSAFSDYPGALYPNLFVIGATPRAPHTAAEVEQAVYEELDRLKKEPVSPRELQKILNQVDAGLVRSLRSNSGMASRLSYFQAINGDWRETFRQRDRIAKVTPEDIRRVASKYFVKGNRIIATLVRPAKPESTKP